MAVIFYSSSDTGEERDLYRVIEESLPEERIEAFHSMESLLKRLIHSVPGKTDIAVLIVSSTAEIYEVSIIYEYLYNTRIMLILKDQDTELMRSGFRIYPRYIGYISDNHSEIGLVLNRMYRNINGKEY